MNILGYTKRYGNLTFQEKPFNHIDALILVNLSYLNFELFSSSDDSISIHIRDIPDYTIVKLCVGEFTTKSNEKLIRLLKTSNRYKDIEIRYIRHVYDAVNTIQFFALTLIIPNYHPIICFRGTDLSLVGWKEDLMLSIHDVLPSQIEALNYVYYVSKKIDGPFSIGGHSKGANLSLFASIFSSTDIRNRIDKSYLFDGPGFRDNRYYSLDKYNQIKNKIVQIVPKDDVVGALFYTPKEKLFVKARSVHFLQHNPYTWKIDKTGEFKYYKKEVNRVKIRRRTLILFVKELGLEECKFIIDKIVESLGGVDSSLNFRFHLFLIKFKSFIVTHFKYSKEVRKRLLKAVKLFVKIWSESQVYYLKHPNDD